MNRIDFLERLFSMYPLNFNENNIPIWTKAYEEVLTGRIDFNRLFLVMVKNYGYTNVAPSPKWFVDNMNSCIIKDKKCNAVLEVEKWKSEGFEPIPECIKKQIELLTFKLKGV